MSRYVMRSEGLPGLARPPWKRRHALPSEAPPPLTADLDIILNAVADGIVVVDAQGRVVQANGPAGHILGLSHKALESGDAARPALRTVREDGSDYPPDQWPVPTCLRTGERVTGVVLGLWRGSELAWLLVNAVPLRHGPDGPVYGAVGTFTDITVQVTQRQQLQRLSAQLSHVLEGSSDGHFDVCAQSGATQFSSPWASMFGYSEDELEPHMSTYERLTHPDDLAQVRQDIRRTFRGERDRFEGEVRVRHKDGRWRWVLARGKVAERDPRGAPVRIVGAFTDITDRKEAEATLLATRAQLSYALEGSNDGIADWDLRSGDVRQNRRCSAILGYEHDEAEAPFDTFMKRLHPDDVAPLQAAVQALIDGTTIQFDQEHRVQRTDGRWIWVHARGRIVERDADGAPLRAAGTLTDVTARRQAESVLRASLTENERLVKELRQALDEVKTLSALLPMCTFCRQVRDDAGYWQNIEHYISAHTGTLFSHGMCPTCLKTYYPDYSK